MGRGGGVNKQPCPPFTSVSPPELWAGKVLPPQGLFGGQKRCSAGTPAPAGTQAGGDYGVMCPQCGLGLAPVGSPSTQHTPI